MNSKKDIRFIAAGLILVSALGVSANFAAKSSWVSEVRDCGQKLASHAFQKNVRIRLGRSQLDAFAPLIEKVSVSGFQPEFAFRAQCGSFIAAGVKQTVAPLTVSDPLFGRPNIWMDVSSIAVLYDFCVQNEGKERSRWSDPCLNPTIAAAYALALLTNDERIQGVRTALEDRTIGELIALQKSRHTDEQLASVTKEGMQQLNRFMAAFKSRTTETPRMKRGDFLMKDAAAALAIARQQ